MRVLLPFVSVLAIAVLLLSGCSDLSHETIVGSYPIRDIEVHKNFGTVFEVMVRTSPGVKIGSLVDLSYFDGLSRNTTLAEAKQRFGEPMETRREPERHVPVAIYRVPKGEVGFLEALGSGGATPEVRAYPKDPSPAAVITNSSFCAQLLLHLPTNGIVRVYILRDIGSAGQTLGMNSNRVEYLILGRRDGEA